MLIPGAYVELVVERPAAGGRMIGRHEGQVVLVSGTIPGEHVRVRIDRAERSVAYATVVDVLQASPHRRPVIGDPQCGGGVFSHVAYARQVELKSEIVADAFRRIGKLPLERPVPVVPSPEKGYRMRARLHVRAGRDLARSRRPPSRPSSCRPSGSPTRRFTRSSVGTCQPAPPSRRVACRWHRSTTFVASPTPSSICASGRCRRSYCGPTAASCASPWTTGRYCCCPS